MARDVVFMGAVRTAIGDYGRALKDVPPATLGALCIAQALKRTGVEAARVEHVVMGNVVLTEPRDAYLARMAAVEAGIPVETPALTLNRLCGSGLQALISAAQMIRLGDIDCAVAGGAESMSRGGYMLTDHRWGARMNDSTLADMVVGVLNDPFGNGHMGVTAETIAAQYDIGREAQDAFAAESHRRACAAIAAGRFVDQIVPVPVPGRGAPPPFVRDEHPRADVTAETLAGLRAAFKREGSVTAGNASSLNDGAAALVLIEGEGAARHEGGPKARLVAYAHAGVDPKVMGLGPIPAVRKVCATSGLAVDQMDVIESNEAFAAQACAVARDLRFPADRTNPNGGAVALGHPVGATGAILTVKAMHELHRIGGRYGLVTLCIGGGQGIAMIIEHL